MARIVVLGGAESGVGAAVLAKVKGFDVFLSDFGQIKDEYVQTLRKWDIPFEQGGHTEGLILNADEVIKSPGIPSTAPMVKKLADQGTHIVSEIEFASRYDSAKKICITGSNGKTTTTSLIYYLLKEAGLNAGLGGNIGKSYAMQVATEQHDYYVLEISSFQLDDTYDFRPDIAIITNITPDHLDRYGFCMDNYAKAKMRIAMNLRPEDVFIYDTDNPETMKQLGQSTPRCILRPFAADSDILNIPEDELSLKGRHNLYNCMAATLAARAAGVPEEVIGRTLRTFKPIEHRLELVRTLDGVTYINDSKATNVDAAWYALDAQTGPVVWIVGGGDKGNDYEVLKPLVKRKVKAIVCLGIENGKFHEAFEPIVGADRMYDTRDTADAVARCREFASEGDVVLLSPCCTSFDLFTCYEQRGDVFREAVEQLK